MKKQGLPLKFDYRMMSLIRELVQKERHRVWMDEYAPNFMRGTSPEEFKEGYKKVIEDNRNPWLRQGLCNLVLDQCYEVEDLLKACLKGKNIFCETCGEERWITRSEPARNYEFLPLPRWRLLSCGHMIDLTGKVFSEEEKTKIYKELQQLMDWFRSKVE